MISSMDLGPKLLQAFGLDSKDVISFKIECDVNAPVSITVDSYVNLDPDDMDETLDKIATQTKQYLLVEKE